MEKKKDTKKVRGTATYYDNGDMDFTAQKEGQPSQEVIKKSKTGKLYKTTSKDKPKLCAYLSCDADAPDAPVQLENQLEDFLKGFGGKNPEEKPIKKDKVLWDDNGVLVWYSTKEKAVKVTLSLSVEEGKNYEQETINKTSKVFQCFTINKQFLVQRGRALKKTSKG